MLNEISPGKGLDGKPEVKAATTKTKGMEDRDQERQSDAMARTIRTYPCHSVGPSVIMDLVGGYSRKWTRVTR